MRRTFLFALVFVGIVSAAFGLTNAEFLSQCLDTAYPGIGCANEHEFAEFVRRHVRAHGIGGYPARGDIDAKTRAAYRREAASVLEGVFTECGIAYRFPEGKVDWRYNPTPDKYAEWTWQFNRHGFLQKLARDYRANGDERTACGWMALLESWMAQAPCPPDGKDVILTDVCWRTIDTGMRLDEWTRNIDPFVDSPSVTDAFLTRYFASMWENAHFLTTRLSQANWLIHELEGLLDVALVFPFFKDAPSWRKLAERRLVAELTRQVYPDGFQVELCPGYHGICLDKYIRMSDLYRKTGSQPPAAFRGGIARMFGIYGDLATCRGSTPPLNDSGWGKEGGLASIMRRASAIFPDREDFRFFATEGREGKPPSALSLALPYAGAVTFRSAWKKDGVWAYLDASPFGVGHQHEDKLNFLLEAYGKRMLTEGGVFAYDKSEMRAYVLSTRAHNTVRIDNRGQDSRSAYRWHGADRVRPAQVATVFSNSRDVVEASYGDETGECYKGARPGDFKHRRRIVFVKNAPRLSPFFLVVDRLLAEDRKPHAYEQMWHIDLPSVRMDVRGFVADFGCGVSLVSFCSDPEAVVRDCRGAEGLDADGRGLQGWLPASGRTRRPISTPVYEGSFTRARRIVTLMYPCRGECPIRDIKASIDATNEVVDLVLSDGTCLHLSESFVEDGWDL